MTDEASQEISPETSPAEALAAAAEARTAGFYERVAADPAVFLVRAAVLGMVLYAVASLVSELVFVTNSPGASVSAYINATTTWSSPAFAVILAALTVFVVGFSRSRQADTPGGRSIGVTALLLGGILAITAVAALTNVVNGYVNSTPNVQTFGNWGYVGPTLFAIGTVVPAVASLIGLLAIHPRKTPPGW